MYTHIQYDIYTYMIITMIIRQAGNPPEDVAQALRRMLSRLIIIVIIFILLLLIIMIMIIMIMSYIVIILVVIIAIVAVTMVTMLSRLDPLRFFIPSTMDGPNKARRRTPKEHEETNNKQDIKKATNDTQ